MLSPCRDLIPDSGITPDRAAAFSFTAPVETFVVSILARTDIPDIEGLDDLIGLALAVDVVLRRPVARNRGDDFRLLRFGSTQGLIASQNFRGRDTQEVRKTIKRIPTENKTPIQLMTLSNPWKGCRRSNSIGLSNPYSLTGTESNLKPGFDRECLFCQMGAFVCRHPSNRTNYGRIRIRHEGRVSLRPIRR